MTIFFQSSVEIRTGLGRYITRGKTNLMGRNEKNRGTFQFANSSVFSQYFNMASNFIRPSYDGSYYGISSVRPLLVCLKALTCEIMNPASHSLVFGQVYGKVSDEFIFGSP